MVGLLMFITRNDYKFNCMIGRYPLLKKPLYMAKPMVDYKAMVSFEGGCGESWRRMVSSELVKAQPRILVIDMAKTT